MTALYNEIDDFAASWIERLAAAGHVASGVVDRRDVKELSPEDVSPHAQAHFFAGIAGWSLALRLAGWPDEVPVWTGSCPCQPFSVAGKRGGVNDSRHVWPDWFRLIRESRPHVVFGEQVASPDGLEWFDAVSADLEGAGYAVGAADLCAAGAGAPHVRQRLYFVAHADGCAGGQGCPVAARRDRRGEPQPRPRPRGRGCAGDPDAVWLVAEPNGERLEGLGLHLRERQPRPTGVEASGRREAGVVGDARLAGGGRDAGAVPGAEGGGARRGIADRRVADEPLAPGAAGVAHDASSSRLEGRWAGVRLKPQHAGPGGDSGSRGRTSATSGFWADAEWVWCRDGKWRPVGPGSFPLAHGVPARVGRLRGYGNAIVPWVAVDFIRAFMQTIGMEPG